MAVEDGAKTAGGGHRHAFAAAALGQDIAMAIEHPQPEAAGAPVHGDIGGIAHATPPRMAIVPIF